MSKTYYEKLKDPRWQKKRLEILERDEFRCQNCGSKTDTLNIHHWHYNNNPWECDDSEVITLCSVCHDLISKKIALIKNTISNYLSSSPQYNDTKTADNQIVKHVTEFCDTLELISNAYTVTPMGNVNAIMNICSQLMMLTYVIGQNNGRATQRKGTNRG